MLWGVFSQSMFWGVSMLSRRGGCSSARMSLHCSYPFIRYLGSESAFVAEPALHLALRCVHGPGAAMGADLQHIQSPYSHSQRRQEPTRHIHMTVWYLVRRQPREDAHWVSQECWHRRVFEAFVVIWCCSCVCKSIVKEFADRCVADLFVGLVDH